MEVTMLTTLDNPFNPFLQWKDWYTYDVTMGYNTYRMLANLTNDSEELDDLSLEMVKQEIVKYNPFNYVLVTKESFGTK